MIRFVIIIFILIQFIYSQDKGLSSFEKENYKESFEYYLKVLDSRENDISAKFGAGISAFKNQDIETGMKYLQEVSNSEDEILSSRAHFNLANIFKDENKLEESLYHYKKAIELNSKDIDSKINYELLKKMLSQEDQESQNNSGDENKKDQDSQGNKGDENDENQEDQGSQSNAGDAGEENQEDQRSQSNPGDEGEENQEDQGSKSSSGDDGDENQEDQESQTNKASDAKNKESESNELSDKQIQAEAILNALKNQEKINQKQKLTKIKAITLEKDW